MQGSSASEGPENSANLRFSSEIPPTYPAMFRGPHLDPPLDKDAPDFRRPVLVGDIAAIPILGGLHHQYVRH